MKFRFPFRISVGWLIGAFVSISYLLAFMQRTGPGVISDKLQSEFHVSSAMLGTMSSIQYLLYMILQIPVGLFGDKFGPVKLLVTGVLCDGVGTLIFANAHSFPVLLAGRAVVGLGDALIWVNIVLILGTRFAPSVFGSMLGIVSTSGNVGALLTTIPFAAWTAVAGWRGPFTTLGILLAVVAILDFIVLRLSRDSVVESTQATGRGLQIQKVPVFHILKMVVRDRNAWATFACHFAAVGTYIGFFGLWAVPYFMDTYHVSRAGATVFTLIAFIGAALGGPITGAISDKLGTRRKPYVVLQTATTLAWALVPVFMGHPPIWILYFMMFVIGFGSGGSLLTFAVIRDQTPTERSGVTSGFANTGGFLSAVLLPVLYGGIIDLLTPASQKLHVSAHAYMLAFLVPTVFSLVGIIGSLGIVEKVSGEERLST